jgi:hypothetical protein
MRAAGARRAITKPQMIMTFTGNRNAPQVTRVPFDVEMSLDMGFDLLAPFRGELVV